MLETRAPKSVGDNGLQQVGVSIGCLPRALLCLSSLVFDLICQVHFKVRTIVVGNTGERVQTRDCWVSMPSFGSIGFTPRVNCRMHLGGHRDRSFGSVTMSKA
jgi:hypothetical protein